jgi:hypothetical protein
MRYEAQQVLHNSAYTRIGVSLSAGCGAYRQFVQPIEVWWRMGWFHDEMVLSAFFSVQS